MNTSNYVSLVIIAWRPERVRAHTLVDPYVANRTFIAACARLGVRLSAPAGPDCTLALQALRMALFPLH